MAMRPIEVASAITARRSEEHTSELQSPCNLVCRLLLEKKKKFSEGVPPPVLLAVLMSRGRADERALLPGDLRLLSTALLASVSLYTCPDLRCLTHAQST